MANKITEEGLRAIIREKVTEYGSTEKLGEAVALQPSLLRMILNEKNPRRISAAVAKQFGYEMEEISERLYEKVDQGS